MERRFDRLGRDSFDLLVVGGGIYGAWTAYDAALRGLSVALVERHDWAAGTSSASSKLIHGGLRYLQYLRLRLVRTALQERERLIRLGPHRVQRLEFLLPVYAGSRVGRFRLGVGLWLYDRLAGAGPPHHGALTRSRLVERYPFLEPDGLRGGFTFGDCQTDDARFVLEIVDGALGAGAVAVNRAEAGELIVDGGRVRGARVRDGESGRTVDLRARVTVHCAGPWTGRLLEGALPRAAPRTRLSKGVHLVLPPLPTRSALLLISRSAGRVVFLMPWHGRTLLGTTDTDFRGDPDDARVEEADVDDLLDQANAALAGVRFRREDVRARFCGLRTLPASDDASPASVTREWTVQRPLPGLLVSIGGKLTSARADAERLVGRVERELGRAATAAPTRERPLPWCPEGDYARWAASRLSRCAELGFDAERGASLLERYGRGVDVLLERVTRQPELGERVLPDFPFCLAEALHAVEREMALDLRDVLERRLPLLRVAALPADRVRRVAQAVAQSAGWDEARVRRELEALVPLADGAAVGR